MQDTVVFEVTLNFSEKRKGVYTGPNLEKADVPQALPLVLTRKIVLGQVMMIFDPLGFVCPFTLLGKIYLRETWSQKLGWDDQLPTELRAKWVRFFNRGCLLLAMEVISPMVLQPTADGNLTMVTSGVDLLWQSVVLPQ